MDRTYQDRRSPLGPDPEDERPAPEAPAHEEPERRPRPQLCEGEILQRHEAVF